MKRPYSFSHIRQKDGEPLSGWFVRVIEWAISESSGREGRIRFALHEMERLAHDDSRQAARREADDHLKRETEPLHKRIAELELMLRGTVSRIDAEAACESVALAMRNKAEFAAMNPDDTPTPTSEAIAALPLPKTRWAKAARPSSCA